MENLIIERLAEKAKRGDINALIALCKAIVGSVFFKANCILDNRMDAEDVAQEVLIRVCMKIKDLKDPKSFNAWLGKIIINETRRQMSKNSKDATFDIDDFTDTELEECEEFLPQEYLEKEADRDSVMEAIRLLPERQREAVVLHYYDGLSITETAEAMGVSQPAASLYLKLARERIKNEIGNSRLHSMTAMPLGVLIAQSMQTESGAFLQSNHILAQRAMDGCAAYIKGMAAKMASEPVAVSAALKIGIAIGVVATAIGIGAGITPGQTEASALPGGGAGDAVNANAAGELVFSGGDPEYAYMNPRSVYPRSDSDFGKLSIRDWRITTADGKAVLYSGKGGDADQALAMMRESGEDGEYILLFSMTDAQGKEYILYSNFLIHTASE